MGEISAGVRLSLRDQFSSGIKGAGLSVSEFGNAALGVANKVNSAFSGLAGTLATVGVTVGIGAAVKTYIDLDDRIVRIGTNIGATAEQTNKLKRRLYEVAQDPSIKMGTDSLLQAIEAFSDKNFDTDFIMDNLRDVGVAMKATGTSGEEMANFFIESLKKGMSQEEIMGSLDDMSVIGDQLRNQFGLGAFTKALPGLEAVNALLGKSAMNTTELFTAMNILGAGTKSPQRAVSAYTAIVNELSDPGKQAIFYSMGLNLRDSSYQFRNFSDILQELSEKGKEIGFDSLSTVFSSAGMDAIMAYNRFGHLADGLEDLGDTTGVLEEKASSNAASLKSNFENLQTAFMGFTDGLLDGPLKELTGFLNELSEDPEKIDRYFKIVAGGLGAIAGIKIGAGIISFIGNLRHAFGKRTSVNLSGSGSGGAGIPVYVTNMGGGGLPLPNAPVANNIPTAAPAGGLAKAAPVLAAAAPYAALAAGTVGLGILIDKIATEKYQIDGVHYRDLESQARRSAAVGDHSGETEARIAALKLQIPVYEKERAGFPSDLEFQHMDIHGSYRMVTLDDLKNELAALQLEIPQSLQNEIRAVPQLPNMAPAKALLEGYSTMDVNINIDDDVTRANLVMRNDNPYIRFNTGSSWESRRLSL